VIAAGEVDSSQKNAKQPAPARTPAATPNPAADDLGAAGTGNEKQDGGGRHERSR